MLGGIQAFGLIGIIVGPLIMAVYMSFVAIVKDFEDEDNGLAVNLSEGNEPHVPPDRIE